MDGEQKYWKQLERLAITRTGRLFALRWLNNAAAIFATLLLHGDYYRGEQLQEHGVDVVASFGAGFNERHIELARQSAADFRQHHAFFGLVHFVAYQNHAYVLIGLLFDSFHPVAHMVERFC